MQKIPENLWGILMEHFFYLMLTNFRCFYIKANINWGKMLTGSILV
jgi:hypothetical protein